MARIGVTVWPVDKTMLDELSEAVRPLADGETDSERDTVPEKPRLANPRFVVAEDPAAKLVDEGLTDKTKSDVTFTGNVVPWTREPLVAVTMTL